jgi:hypothetical protein
MKLGKPRRLGLVISTIQVSLKTWRCIYMYTNAVENNVMLQSHLWHCFYNIIFKIKKNQTQIIYRYIYIYVYILRVNLSKPQWKILGAHWILSFVNYPQMYSWHMQIFKKSGTLRKGSASCQCVILTLYCLLIVCRM